MFGDPDEISVMEGDSVTLNSDHTEMSGDEILWWFVYTETNLIADINKQANRFNIYEDHVLDGRFRDRLKLDNQTGYLTITNTTTEHAGDYEQWTNKLFTIFSLTVYGECIIGFIYLFQH